VGFKCFSDDCCDYGIKDLLDLMEEETGIAFLLDDPAGMARAWGGLEIL
jgi:hypothetical protein